MPAKTHPSRASVDGEAKAEDESKAKARAEAEAKKAEALKAEAEAKNRDAKLDAIRPEVEAAGEGLRTAQTSLGDVLHRAEAFIPSATYSTIQAYAEEVLPDLAGPMWTSSPAYRSLQAARVVESIGAGLVGSTTVDALTFLHRFTPEQRLEVFKAAKGRSRKPSVTRAALVEKAEALYPDESKAKKGPKKGSEAASRGARSKARKAEKAAVSEVLDAIGAIRPEVEVEPSGPIVKEALAEIGKALQGHVDQYGGDAYQAAFEMLSLTVDLADRFTVPVLKAALRFKAEAAEKKTTTRKTTTRK